MIERERWGGSAEGGVPADEGLPHGGRARPRRRGTRRRAAGSAYRSRSVRPGAASESWKDSIRRDSGELGSRCSSARLHHRRPGEAAFTRRRTRSGSPGASWRRTGLIATGSRTACPADRRESTEVGLARPCSALELERVPESLLVDRSRPPWGSSSRRSSTARLAASRSWSHGTQIAASFGHRGRRRAPGRARGGGASRSSSPTAASSGSSATCDRVEATIYGRTQR